MSPKNRVLKLYPKAYSYRLASWLVHIRRGNRKYTIPLAWGSNPHEAWKKAAEKVKSAEKRKSLTFPQSCCLIRT